METRVYLVRLQGARIVAVCSESPQEALAYVRHKYGVQTTEPTKPDFADITSSCPALPGHAVAFTWEE